MKVGIYKINDEEGIMQKLASVIDKCLEDSFGHKLGFALLVFEFDKSGIGNYISNAERETMILSLRETADRLELKQEMPKTEGSA